MEHVTKLTQEEALAARPLWSEIFYEDSEQFTDYYFQEKMQDNTGYGLWIGEKLAAMLFLTPYTGCISMTEAGGKHLRMLPLSYIVGVGTKREYRHRGYMDRLLRRALQDLYGLRQPFTFLMPADPAIYRPYQFCYIYDRPEFSILKKEDLPAVKMLPEEAGQLAEFAQKQLMERYQFFLYRDAAYYRRQQKESRVQNGDVYLWKENGSIAGFYLYAKEGETEEIQEAVVAPEFAKKGVLSVSEQKKPMMMARITCVEEMLSLLRLSPLAEMEKTQLTLKVEDPVIAGNNHTFLWTVGKKESTIAILENFGNEDVCMKIEELTAFVFGRAGKSRGVLPCVEPISNIFLNELV